MNGLRSAMGFLTILPLAPASSGGLATARGWFPVVGLLIGCLLAGLDLLMQWGYPHLNDTPPTFPPLLAATILVVALAVITRALHLDGFMDCCDALLGGFDRERRLEILKDPRVGAFAVVGAVSLLLVKVAAIMALPAAWRTWALLLFPCLSRCGMLLALERFRYVRPEGIGLPFQPSGPPWQLAAGLATAALASAVLAWPLGLALFGAACLVSIALGMWATRLLGGVTGDVYGAINELAEVAVLTLAAIVGAVGPASLLLPIHMWSWQGV